MQPTIASPILTTCLMAGFNEQSLFGLPKSISSRRARFQLWLGRGSHER